VVTDSVLAQRFADPAHNDPFNFPGRAVRRSAYGWLHAANAPDHRQGWVIVVQKGSHAQLKHPSRGGRVTVPLHAGETIGPGLLRSILSQAGVTVEELRAVL
jgi:predicted RNA binding protein YcfA (HicA-like mRNA interferase family)